MSLSPAAVCIKRSNLSYIFLHVYIVECADNNTWIMNDVRSSYIKYAWYRTTHPAFLSDKMEA